MHEINLQYVGKKPLPRELDVPVLKMGKILFSPNAWLPAHAAKKLMEINPSMFVKVGEKNGPEIEDAADIIAKKAEEDDEEVIPYICEKCGKDYKVLRFYENHIAKCEGPVDD